MGVHSPVLMPGLIQRMRVERWPAEILHGIGASGEDWRCSRRPIAAEWGARSASRPPSGQRPSPCWPRLRQSKQVWSSSVRNKILYEFKSVYNSFKKLNILLMRSNANLLLNRCPVIRDVVSEIEPVDPRDNFNWDNVFSVNVIISNDDVRWHSLMRT